MNGIIYCRVSSREQIEGTSLESQKLACTEYAQSKNINVLKVFIEEGESAKFADRTQLLNLIDYCRVNKGKVQVLIVWKIDRFARNVTDHFNIKATLKKYGLQIVSVTEPIDAKPEGKLMETILAGFAQFDNDIRAMRTIQGMRRKLQEGIFPWKAPLGYKGIGFKGEKKIKPDQPDEPLFGLLQRAWKSMATGAYTKAEMRRLMESWGILTPKTRPLSPQSIDNLFRNPFYAGVLIDPWSREEHQGQHIPMVSREDFAQIQKIINKRTRSTRHQKARPEFPLRGLVRCSGCLHFMTGTLSRGRSSRYPYYHCYNKRCPGYAKSYPVQAIHNEFASFLASVGLKTDLWSKLEAILIQVAEERYVFLKKKKARFEAELLRVNGQIQELIRMRTGALITDEEFLTQKSMLSEKRAALESTTSQDSIRGEHVRKQLEEIIQPLLRPTDAWHMLPAPLRGRFERLILPVGFVNKKIQTAELGLLFRLFRDFTDENSTVVPLVRKFWNQILAEIKGFRNLLREFETLKEESKTAVLKNLGEYPSREDLEPDEINQAAA